MAVFVFFRLLFDDLHELGDASVDVGHLCADIVHYRLVVAVHFPAEALRRPVDVRQDAREDLRRFEVAARLPEHLARASPSAIFEVLVVDAAKEQAVEAELREKRRLFARVSEWIDLPSFVIISINVN